MIISIVGHTAIDYLFEVDKLPGPNASAPIVDYHEYHGGGAANIAAGIAKLGGVSQLISPVGADFKNSEYEKYLQHLGVDLDLLYNLSGEKTAKAFIYTDSAHNQTSFFYWGASARFPKLDAPKLDFVHLATGDSVFNANIAQKAQWVSFDPGQDLVTYNQKNLTTILEHTNILFTNRHEISRVSDISKISFEELLNLIDVIVVTQDSKGSIIYENGIESFVSAIKVDAVDPTGAGDAYRAGFLLAYTKKYPLTVCGQIGSTTASFVVERVGCQTNLPTWEMMRERHNAFYDETIK